MAASSGLGHCSMSYKRIFPLLIVKPTSPFQNNAYLFDNL